MAKKNRQFWEAVGKNAWNYRTYYERLMELAVSMFEWENVPDTIDPRFLELALFSDGHAVFFKDEVMGYLSLRCMIGGPFTVYNIPKYRQAYAVNGYNNQLDETNSVIIWNNMVRTNTLPLVELYARRLWDLDRAIDVNAKAQKTPVLITCTEKQKLTMKNLYMAYEGNEPFIFGDEDKVAPNSIKVLQTGAPFVCDKLQQLKTQLWNEILTALGITNVSYQKKERMITDEVVRSQGGTIASRYSRLNARRQAADEINKMYGLNIKVNYRADYREADDEIMLTGETEDNELVGMVTDLRTNAPV